MNPDNNNPPRKVWKNTDDFDEMQREVIEEIRHMEDMQRLGNFETRKMSVYFNALAQSGTPEEQARNRKLAGAMLIAAQYKEKKMDSSDYKATTLEEKQCRIADEWHAAVTAKIANDPAVKAEIENINAYLETTLPEFAEKNPAIARRLGQRNEVLAKKFKQ